MHGFKHIPAHYLDSSAVASRLPILKRRRKSLIVVAAFSILVLIFLAHSTTLRHVGVTNTQPGQPPARVLPPGNLHVLIPADKKDVNLCKTLLSAGIAGFPTPTLINWGAQFTDKNLVAGGSHLAKISGVSAYLESLGPERDNDIVLLVDGYDIWFQLRPSTLISRFHGINKAADARVRASMGAKAMRSEGIKQEIVFSAQKRCWPWKKEDPACAAVPASSLPQSVYGPHTDTDVGFVKNPNLRFRQRYLNSGDAMGRVGALKKLFGRALQKADEDPNFGSDQKIFSGIFGEQEVMREAVRLRHGSYLQRLKEWMAGRKSIFGEGTVRHLGEQKTGETYEFGIGLDYASLIGHPTVFAEDDAAWITHNNAAGIADASAALNVTALPIRVQTLAEDISSSQPPFRPAVLAPDAHFDMTTSWTDVPLYTNMWTAVVPGLIHHNAHRDGMKKLRKTWWDRPWFFSHARRLYESHVKGPVAPVAVVRDEEMGTEQAWWSPIADKGGAKSDKGEWLGWGELCGTFESEIFRDA
ncbi:hypothetical protein ACJQWK_04900 [Exserohilum turcicum]|uniref:Uncharacterized protein n=1 Tax=Exserohilum turcicum (strain 28A) TaxID=671987 RepID=R0JP98_EXST2|nr:uncharacterized protein SETTUDRAFT_34531 [Exserohilum turcica Et28A]EOA83018.1 hypothetical protein SETTUDRAFT_34531 [Exserohilum turcica Et28A]